MNEKQIRIGVESLEMEFGRERIQGAADAVRRFKVEIPSWIFGSFGGGRFAGYTPPGAARTIAEKLDDAAKVHALTGATPTVATHMLWDFSDDGRNGSMPLAEKVGALARERGLGVGSVSPTYFLEGSYRGSLSADEKAARDRYIEQTLLAGLIARAVGTGLVTLWFPDGSLYPGQVDLQRAWENLKSSLSEIAGKMDKRCQVLIEYKVFEPGTYSTVVSDWGSAYILAKAFGPNAGVLVDLGHHFHAANIEQIVGRLVAEGMRCGFHFNTRYAADDDHSVEPNPEMARIFDELVKGKVVANPDPVRNWAYMIDQASGRENRMHAILHSVDSLQLSLAKAMLVDGSALRRLQDQDEIVLANRLLNDALVHADVRPLVAATRLESNLPADPVTAFAESGYQADIEKKRK